MLAALVIVVVSAALVARAVMGMYAKLPPAFAGFIVAMAGGALMCPRSWS